MNVERYRVEGYYYTVSGRRRLFQKSLLASSEEKARETIGEKFAKAGLAFRIESVKQL